MGDWLDIRKQVLERIVTLEALLPDAFAKQHEAHALELARAVVGAVGIDGLEDAARHASELERLLHAPETTASDVHELMQKVRHAVEAATPPRPPPMPALGLHVLVVDDDPVTRKVLRHVLEAAECWVHEWPSAHDVPAAVAQNQADVVLMDLHLADGRGVDACTALRHDAGTRAMPILVLTGDQEPTAANVAYGAGADDFIVKPVRARELVARIQHAVGKHARNANLQARALRSLG